MSSDIQKVLVLDSRLDCSDKITYAVVQGAQSVNPAPFVAVSSTVSSHTYNIQVPSETTIIDRRVLFKSTVVLSIVGTPPIGEFNVNYGITDALAPFPLHQLINVMTAQINNNSVSLNVRDVLPALLRFQDPRELARYNGTCPTAVDTYQKYSDAVGASNNVLGAFQNVSDNSIYPRGSWVLDSITGNAIGDGTARTTIVTFTCAEPLLISPFLSCNPKSNSQGIYGVQNMNFQFSMGDATRVWRHASAHPKTVTVTSYANSKLLFNFLSPHPSQLLQSRNIVPYAEFPRYLTAIANAGTTNTSASFSSSTIQLNVIPDKLIIFIRKSGALLNSDTDSFFTLSDANPVSISFNNVSGILSSASIQDLYRMSVENGSNQSFLEFTGFANLADPTTGGPNKKPLSGSLLVLEFGKDIPLQEQYYAAGSLGSFSLQVTLNAFNQGAATIGAQELVIITMNSGVMALERGSASVYTGLLTKKDVLEVVTQTPYFRADAERLVGGGFMDSLKSVVGKVLPYVMPIARKYLRESGDTGSKVDKALSSLGMGKSGGRMHDRLM